MTLYGLPTDTLLVLAVFALVYLGMLLGGLPGLRLDRTGVALLGAIAVVGLGAMTPQQAAAAVHLPTLLLLFSFMVVSAQMRLGGFYGVVTRRLTALRLGPGGLLAAVVAVVALLSAVFSNDIVCLAVAPVLARGCLRRGLDPVPFLLALACAANIGSAATLIGNPQNMLIGEVLRLPFGAYTAQALVPVLASLALLWVLLLPAARRAGRGAAATAAPARPAGGGGAAAGEDDEPPFDAWQTAKGLAVALALVAAFLLTAWPRDVAALLAAGLLLLSARFHSSRVMGLVDWELLVLFIGLFVVNQALADTGLTARAIEALAAQGLALADTTAMLVVAAALSNLVSNVPAVMLLLPAAEGVRDGTTLALASTLAGNLVIVGSIANIIVVDAARKAGVAIDWRRHAATGVPVTLGSLALAWLWLVAGPAR